MAGPVQNRKEREHELLKSTGLLPFLWKKFHSHEDI
jgi:hypothetical protein